MQRTLRLLLGIGITAFFLYLLLWQLDWQKLAAVYRSLPLPPLLLGLAVLALDFFLRIVRWWRMLQAMEPALPLSNCIGPYLASIAINNLMPLRAGDVVRVMGFRERLKSTGMRVLGTLVIERLLDLLVLLIIFFVGLMPLGSSQFPGGFVQFAIGSAFVGSVMLLVLIFLPHRVHAAVLWMLKRLRPHAAGGSDRVHARLEHFFDALSILRSRRLTTELLSLSAAAWLLEGVVFACIAWAILDAVPDAAPFFALATGVLSTLIPSAPGYVGTFDYFTMQGLVAYGVSREHATGFALLVHLVLWLPLTLAGTLCLLLPATRTAAATASTAKR